MASLTTPAGAAGLARVLAATGNRPQRVIGVRSHWWECKYPVRAFTFFACSKADGPPVVQAACFLAGVISAFISLCFWVARRRERESFVVVVTDVGDFASSKEDMGFKCDNSEGQVVMQVGRAGDIFKVRRHASQLWENSFCQCCEDSYWLNCCIEGGFPCWDTVNVYLADPVTRQRKTVQVCCNLCTCPAPADHRFDCLQDARAVEAALNEAHAHAASGAQKNFVVESSVVVVQQQQMVLPAGYVPSHPSHAQVAQAPAGYVVQQAYVPQPMQMGFPQQQQVMQQPAFPPQQQMQGNFYAQQSSGYPYPMPPPGYNQRF